MKPYAVLQFGSHPDLDNDDCYEGADYESKDEALAAFSGSFPYAVEYVVIDGPDIHETRKNPSFNRSLVARERREADREWQRESAMQAGMLGGVGAYNDAMGWS